MWVCLRLIIWGLWFRMKRKSIFTDYWELSWSWKQLTAILVAVTVYKFSLCLEWLLCPYAHQSLKNRLPVPKAMLSMKYRQQKHCMHLPAFCVNIWPTPVTASLHVFIIILCREKSPSQVTISQKQLWKEVNSSALFCDVPGKRWICILIFYCNVYYYCPLQGEISNFGKNQRNSCTVSDDFC